MDISGIHLDYERTKAWICQIGKRYLFIKFYAISVSKGHLSHCFHRSAGSNGISGLNLSFLNQFMDLFVDLLHFYVNRKIISICRKTQTNQTISWFLQFRCNYILYIRHINSKRYQSRRHIDIIKRTGHTVFSANRRKAKSDLCLISTKQGCYRLSPACLVLSQTFEIFLERKTDLFIISSRCDNL